MNYNDLLYSILFALLAFIMHKFRKWWYKKSKQKYTEDDPGTKMTKLQLKVLLLAFTLASAIYFFKSITK